MAIRTWNPWRDFAQLEQELRRTLEWPLLGTGNGGRMFPAIDVFPRGTDLVIRAELPGVDPEKDVSVTLEEGLVRIHGERKHEETEERKGYFRKECYVGTFDRGIPVPDTVTDADVHATFDKGVLEVVVTGAGPSTEPEPKKIPIESPA